MIHINVPYVQNLPDVPYVPNGLYVPNVSNMFQKFQMSQQIGEIEVQTLLLLEK